MMPTARDTAASIMAYFFASLATISPIPAVIAAIVVPISEICPVFKKLISAVRIDDTMVATPNVVVFQFMPLSVCQSYL